MTVLRPSRPTARPAPPPSDVSAGVGLCGLLGLLAWIALCRSYPAIADALGFGGSLSSARGVLSGPYAALAAILFTAVPMALWSVLIDKVHLRPRAASAHLFDKDTGKRI